MNIQIPSDKLVWMKQALHNLVDERSSAPWADYSEEELSVDEQDREDIEKIQTVVDVLNWLQQQGGRTLLVEYASCPLPRSAARPPDRKLSMRLPQSQHSKPLLLAQGRFDRNTLKPDAFANAK